VNRLLARVLPSSAGAHFRPPAPSHHARLRRLVAPVTGVGLLDLQQDSAELQVSGACSGGNFSYDPLLYRSGVFRWLHCTRYAISADSCFLIDFLRSVDEGISPKMVR
jgi:hypothetical protein